MAKAFFYTIKPSDVGKVFADWLPRWNGPTNTQVASFDEGKRLYEEGDKCIIESEEHLAARKTEEAAASVISLKPCAEGYASTLMAILVNGDGKGVAYANAEIIRMFRIAASPFHRLDVEIHTLDFEPVELED